MKGKLIVIYGINNLGKTTQAKKLVEWLINKGYTAEYLKYPIYDLKPSGQFINAILREGMADKMSAQEIQMWYALNRIQFQPQLLEKLERGIIVIAEDYVGTGIAWGVAEGADLEWLECLNKPLRKEDASIMLYGQRFMSAAEKNHFHESDRELTEKCQKIHLELAEKKGWNKVNANNSVEQVHAEIIRIAEKSLKNTNI